MPPVVTIEARTITSDETNEFIPLQWVRIHAGKDFSRELLRLRWMLFKNGLSEVRVLSAPESWFPTVYHVVKHLGAWELVVSRKADGVYFCYEAAADTGATRIEVAHTVPQLVDDFLVSVKRGRRIFGDVPGMAMHGELSSASREAPSSPKSATA